MRTVVIGPVESVEGQLRRAESAGSGFAGQRINGRKTMEERRCHIIFTALRMPCVRATVEKVASHLKCEEWTVK
jgi:hypothetical protein